MNGLPRSQLQRAAVIRRGLRDKAVLIRNRRESRMEEENEGGRLAYVVRTSENDTSSVRGL